MFHVRGAFKFFQGEGTKFRHFFGAQFFPAELILSNLSNKRTLGGSEGIFPRKIFENLLTVMAILVLFEQFLGKVCSYFWPLSLSASPNMMHFVGTVSIMRALRSVYTKCDFSPICCRTKFYKIFDVSSGRK